jgi:2-haloalkanoic acid dehalogenase type II
MQSTYDYVTFDCYGTLVDWETGISEAFVQAAAQDGVSLQPAEVLASYAKIEPIVEAGDYRPYRDVLRETALRVAARHAWSLDEARADFLSRSLADWPPFDETRPALRRLQSAGIRIGILSNVDLELLRQTLDRLDVEFDLLVTAQQVRAYKPDHAHFQEARRRIGTASWLHAAQSYFHDIVPATELGIPVAWINRHDESPQAEARPDRNLRTLEQLSDWLTAG